MTPQRRSEVVFPELEPPETDDKGSAWPVFLVLVFAVAVVFIAGAWLIGRIAWGVVV